MKIYELVYPSDGSPDGYAHHYDTSLAKLRRLHRDIIKETKEAQAKHDDWKGDSYETPVAPMIKPEWGQIIAFELLGTVRQMVLKALERNT